MGAILFIGSVLWKGGGPRPRFVGFCWFGPGTEICHGLLFAPVKSQNIRKTTLFGGRILPSIITQCLFMYVAIYRTFVVSGYSCGQLLFRDITMLASGCRSPLEVASVG